MSTTTTTSVTRKRQSMAPSAVVVSQTPVGHKVYGPGSMTRRSNVVSSSYGAPPMLRPTGEAGKVSRDSVQTVMSSRGKEKKEIAQLNSRFANYIENVKYLGAQNKTLVDELERLKKMKGYTQARVKDDYEDELREARETIDALSKELAPLQSKNLALQDKIDTQDVEIAELRKQRDSLNDEINKLNTLCGELEGECATLRRRCEAVMKENDMLKNDVQRLRDDNDRIRHDSEAAITKQINAENELHAVTEELQFITETTTHEIEELKNLLENLKATQPDVQKFWKSEFKDAINDVQAEYNDQLERMCAEQQRRFDEQLASIQANQRRDGTDSSITKTENKNLKSNMSDLKTRLGDLEAENARLNAQLRALQDKYDQECEDCEREKAELNEKVTDLQNEMEDVMETLAQMEKTKMDLELEISCYRKLLESEENRIQGNVLEFKSEYYRLLEKQDSMKRIIEGQGKMQSQGGAELANIIMGGRGGGSSGGGGGGGSSSQQSTPDKSKKQPEPKKAAKKPENAMGESTGMVRLTRSSRVNVSILEAAQDGSFVKLDNGNTKDDFDLSNWKLERKHPKGTSTFKFPSNSKVKKGSSLKVYSALFDDMCEEGDFVGQKETCRTWGTGNGGFSLKDPSGNEKASCSITYNVK